MPWSVVHNHPACRRGEWAVVNEQAEAEGRHSIEGCHSTREEALAQQRALYANEPAAGRQASSHEVKQMEPRRLFAPIEQKAITDAGAGEISGLAAVYGTVDLQDDLLEPGSFAKSAEDWSRSKSKVPLLDWHGESLSRIIGSVAQLKSIPQGLWFRAGFTRDEQGQRARQLAKDGHLTGVSVGWLPVHASLKVISGKAVRAIREARLLEISLTPVPANPQAQLASVKSLDVDGKAADPKKPYGDVEYADPGYQDDGKKRYPLDTEEHCRAAWSYINQADNAAKYSTEELARIKARIRAALQRYGVQVSESSSLAYQAWAPAMRKALDIDYEPAAKAAAHVLLAAYDPDDAAAGLADGPPTATAAAPEGTAGPVPPTMTPEQYALQVISPGPRDDAPEGEPFVSAGASSSQALADSHHLLEDLRTLSDLDQLEGEINRALGRNQE